MMQVLYNRLQAILNELHFSDIIFIYECDGEDAWVLRLELAHHNVDVDEECVFWDADAFLQDKDLKTRITQWLDSNVKPQLIALRALIDNHI